MAQLADDDVIASPFSEDAERRAPRTASLHLQIFADSADRDLAADIASRLIEDGHEIVGGALDPHVIDAVVIIWSQGALSSPAMLAAARAAQTTTPIIPISVGAVSAPPDFPEPAPMPLDGWLGDVADPRWRFVLDELSLVALRRGPPAFLRPQRVDAFDDGAPDFTPAELAAEPRAAIPTLKARRAGVDGLTLLMAAAALVLFSVFALLPSRMKPTTLKTAENAVPSAALPTDTAGAQTPIIQTRDRPPAAPIQTHVEVPLAAAPIAATVTPTLEAPKFRAPPPSLKPKRPSARPVPQTPHVKHVGVVDPLAALIVKTTNKSEIKAAKTFRDCISCPPMVRVSPGKLVTAQDRQIAVARPFALGAHEVTFAEWDACVIDGGCRAYRPSDAGWGRGGRPVVNVSFEDATAYADWLSAKTGARYRLPSDEEWTYAAASGGGAPVPAAKAPAAAPSVPADARGARGLLGNVWEWTADCTDWDPSGACTTRIVKGGAWNTGEWRKTPHHRLSKPEDIRDYDLGFRIARDF